MNPSDNLYEEVLTGNYLKSRHRKSSHHFNKSRSYMYDEGLDLNSSKPDPSDSYLNNFRPNLNTVVPCSESFCAQNKCDNNNQRQATPPGKDETHIEHWMSEPQTDQVAYQSELSKQPCRQFEEYQRKTSDLEASGNFIQKTEDHLTTSRVLQYETHVDDTRVKNTPNIEDLVVQYTPQTEEARVQYTPAVKDAIYTPRVDDKMVDFESSVDRERQNVEEAIERYTRARIYACFQSFFQTDSPVDPPCHQQTSSGVSADQAHVDGANQNSRVPIDTVIMNPDVDDCTSQRKMFEPAVHVSEEFYDNVHDLSPSVSESSSSSSQYSSEYSEGAYSSSSQRSVRSNKSVRSRNPSLLHCAQTRDDEDSDLESSSSEEEDHDSDSDIPEVAEC